MWEDDRRVDLFRIQSADFSKSADGKVINYQCEHVLATLIDDVLFQFHAIGNLGTYTPQVIRYVLERQSVKRWNLARCDFAHQYLYEWENENLLAALLSVSNPFLERYAWRTDTTDLQAWQLSLVALDGEQKGEIRYRKNMQSIRKTSDPTNLCTRLYPLGYGEGDNQQTIAEVNGGKVYLDSPNISKYGVIAKVAVDRRYQSAQTLYDYGVKLLREVESPYISYEVDAAQIDGDVQVGDYVRVIDDDEGISELMPVVSIEKEDITGVKTVRYTIANKSEDLASSLADLSDRQKIADLYSQGSVNIDSVPFTDNADESHPARLRFYVSDETVRINSVHFIYSLASFRAYSKSASAGGGSTRSTSSGGGTSKSTSSGGGTTKSTSSGGGTSTSTASGGASTSGPAANASEAKYTYGTSSLSGGTWDMKSPNHRHQYGLLNHTHSTPAHTHKMSVPAHSHDVTIPAHTHDFSIPAHTHDITIPTHTHDLIYGIYEGPRASSARVLVDGREITIAPDTDIDIANYLSVDDSGKIQRGTWHEVQIIPASLSRVEASLQAFVFINPRGGGNL